MPTYTYRCPIHGEFEEFHSITEQLEVCPICQREESEKEPQKVERLISGGTTFVLSGGGWAKEGYS